MVTGSTFSSTIVRVWPPARIAADQTAELAYIAKGVTEDDLAKEGYAHWPTVVLGANGCAAAIAAWRGQPNASTTATSYRDLYIASALVLRCPNAAEVFDDFYVSSRATRIKQTGLAASLLPDVVQVVREKIYAKLTTLEAVSSVVKNGDLLGLTTIIAQRTAIDFLRRASRTPTAFADDAAVFERLLVTHQTPASALSREQTRAQLREALAHSLQALSERDRAILRLHFLHGMKIDAIGELYDVHRATIARWIVRICDEVRDGCKSHLSQSATTSDLAHLLGVLQSSISTGFLGLRDALQPIDATT